MGRVKLLDCTLRDGGYINNWEFGKNAIATIIYKLIQTGIEMIEIGFLKGDVYKPDKTIFPDVKSCESVIESKSKGVTYVAMLDMSNPIPVDRITKNDGNSIDGIRVIFKKDKINDAFVYCEHIKEMGYELFVNFVNTDCYTDKEFIEGIEKYNELKPAGMTIVDTFGMIKRKHFMRLAAIADHNMNPDIMLCYHAHNNLQQAFGNAEALVEMNLSRDICIDACVFGMGRGAGNLNLELFAEYMNENHGCSYRISPILEIMDEYISDFYKEKFWGYSLPLYLSATYGCHPNYAIYLAEKNTLTEKALSELINSISYDDKMVFSKEKAEFYYDRYMENYVDDANDIKKLGNLLRDKTVVLMAPGKSIHEYSDLIIETINHNQLIVITINFYESEFKPNFIFSSNLRRFRMLPKHKNAKVIITSNIKESDDSDYVINIRSLMVDEEIIHDNAGVMALRLLDKIGVQKVLIAGMDGYNSSYSGNYYDERYEVNRHNNFENMNSLIAKEIDKIRDHILIEFITPSKYE